MANEDRLYKARVGLKRIGILKSERMDRQKSMKT